ncbi:MAG: insulinase family protein, partial [Synechococcales cyanobacterium RM1_1_8]|nr:insulinase family protein [Synechococcales cyanobacterium RM1_1_8]
MTFVVMERHEAPVVSFVTHANVGGVDEPRGKTGVAHFLEHLAFKGTPEIGTTDYAKESVLLDQLDQLFDQIKAAKQANDQTQLASLEQRFQQIQKQASQYVRQNELGQVIERNGGVGLNAATSADATTYFYSLPSNKLELWMSLESERFLNPVFREFHEEKQVILEERRMRLENDPVSQLFEALKSAAFQVHPYGQPLIGETEDIEGLTRRDVEAFFQAYYGPDNLVCAIVGDVDPVDVKALAQTYFGRQDWAKGSSARRPVPPEPPQRGERTVELTRPTQPWYMEAYHIPGSQDLAGVPYAILGNILSSGRTSRLYKTLVESQQVALAAQGFTGYPGEKYPNLMVFYGLVAPGHEIPEVAAALQEQLDRLKQTPVTEAELERVKIQVKASVLRSLTSNLGMARLLAANEATTGEWQTLFKELDRIGNLTPADIQTAAQTAFRAENRTVGRLFSSEASPQAAAPASTETTQQPEAEPVRAARPP